MRAWPLLLLAACGAEGTTILPSDAGVASSDAGFADASADAGPPFDPTEAMFDPARVLDVRITLAPNDWDTLRAQTRSIREILGGPMCLDAPFPSPFTYFRGTVSVDGVELADVGVRKKGFIGSLSELRPSLKLKFDEYVMGRKLGGLERMTLNNAQQDPSIVRQCVSYARFAAAGLPAPRCNYARVRVNGTDHGVFVHVESYKKQLLRRHFDDDEGLLYEGTLSDFRPGWTGTFEKKTNEEEPDDRRALAAVVDAIAAPDATVMDALDRVIDLDTFFSFWALEALVAHWDGYSGNTNNFYVYQEPNARFVFLPWGTDGALARGPFLPADTPQSVFANSALSRRLYFLPAGRARYLERMREILDGVWDEPQIKAEIRDARMRLVNHVLDAPRFTTALTELEHFVDARRPAIEAELAMSGRDWTLPERGSPCLVSVATLTATITTSWGTHPAQNPFATGRGGLSFTPRGGGGFTVNQVGGSAGMGQGPDDRDKAVLITVAILPDGAVGVIYVATDPAMIAPNTRIAVDDATTRAILLRAERPGAELRFAGWLDGTIFVDRGGTTPMAPIGFRLALNLLGQR